MSIVVPFDGTDLSTAALSRAREIGDALDAELLVVSIIPTGNREYARERGWLDDAEPYDTQTLVENLAGAVESAAPEATFDWGTVDRRAPPGAIAGEIRKYARTVDADLVVIGSDNAGAIVTNVSSVGGAVAADAAYDVMIVRYDD